MLSSGFMALPALNLPVLPDPAPDVDQRVIVHGVDFQTYSSMRDLLDASGIRLRLTYYCGALEIMTPSRRHENFKKCIARMIEVFALERDIPLYGYGSTTFRREAKERGLEPDECYCVGSDMDEVPQIALEVMITSGGISKLAVYAGLGVREVWFWKDERFELYTLTEQGYQPLARSQFIPALDFEVLARFALHGDQHQAVVAYRDFLRADVAR